MMSADGPLSPAPPRQPAHACSLFGQRGAWPTGVPPRTALTGPIGSLVSAEGLTSCQGGCPEKIPRPQTPDSDEPQLACGPHAEPPTPVLTRGHWPARPARCLSLQSRPPVIPSASRGHPLFCLFQPQHSPPAPLCLRPASSLPSPLTPPRPAGDLSSSACVPGTLHVCPDPGSLPAAPAGLREVRPVQPSPRPPPASPAALPARAPTAGLLAWDCPRRQHRAGPVQCDQ